MKIALCLFGNVGIRKDSSGRNKNDDITKESSVANTDPSICYQAMKKLIIDRYDTDVFIHSWSLKYEQKIKELYKPVTSCFEEQIVFDQDLSSYGIHGESIEDWKVTPDTRWSYELLLPSRGSVKAVKEDLKRISFRAKSRWYSNCYAIDLKKRNEEEKNIKYDFVICSRMDCYFRNFVNLESLDKDKFYASCRKGRVDEAKAFYDFWFFSNSENMDKFSLIYDNLHNYSIRPPFSSRQHVESLIGVDKIAYALKHGVDYDKVR